MNCQVNFYILPSLAEEARLQFACRLCEKAFQHQQKTLVVTNNPHTSKHLDDLLWIYKEDSFIPHSTASSLHLDEQAVIISESAINLDQEFDFIINLSESPIQNNSNKIAEIVNQDPTIKASSREHFRFYQKKGYDLQHHTM